MNNMLPEPSEQEQEKFATFLGNLMENYTGPDGMLVFVETTDTGRVFAMDIENPFASYGGIIDKENQKPDWSDGMILFTEGGDEPVIVFEQQYDDPSVVSWFAQYNYNQLSDNND